MPTPKALGSGSRNTDLDPARSDYIFRFFRHFLRGNPLLIILVYSLFFSGGTVLLAYWHGSLLPVEGPFVAVLEDYANIINCMIVLPVAVWLTVRFYDRGRVWLPPACGRQHPGLR